jgi:hypothetical protein
MMRTALVLVAGAVLAAVPVAPSLAQENERTVEVTLMVPSAAHKLQILEVYQTPKELLVLSKVEGGGIGATVITKAKDQVKVKAPADLPVKQFVLGKTWGWGDEKYTFLKDRADFDKMVKQGMAMKIYQRPTPPPAPPGATLLDKAASGIN